MKRRDVCIVIVCLAGAGAAVVSRTISHRRQPEAAAQAASAPATSSSPVPAPPLPPPKDVVTSARFKGGAEILAVGLAAEGVYISISYRVPPTSARGLRQGTVYVIDEATKTAYREVPVMPTLGPLISHPRQAGQIGYAMLVNAPVPLKKGSIVTVVLGEYRQEHMLIQYAGVRR